MAHVSSVEFDTIKKDLKDASSVEQFRKIYTRIEQLSIDNNMLVLANYFNTILEQQPMIIQIDVALFDLEHVQILINLSVASTSVKQHTNFLLYMFNRNPFDYQKHLFDLNDLIESKQESNHYAYYCTYFKNNVVNPMMQHNPKLASNLPSCVEKLIGTSNTP
ncbi:MAG: hypothetical protein WC627_11750 [Legionella sp.]